MSEEIHQKVKFFLAGEFARQEGRQCVAVELVYAPGGGFKEDPLRKWTRHDEPERFEDLTKIEALVSEIIDIASGEADTRPPGRHRYVVRTHQHLGGRATMSIAMSPQYSGGDTEEALTVGGGGSKDGNIIAAHAGQLMRVNAQMFDGTIRVLGHTNEQLRIENTELRAANIKIQRELDDARSSQLEREFSIAQQMERSQLKSAGIKQLLQFGTIAMAKMTGGAGDTVGGSQSALGMLVFKFGDSLRPDQIQVLMNTLDMGQKALFMEIMGSVAPKEDQPPKAAPKEDQPPKAAPGGVSAA